MAELLIIPEEAMTTERTSEPLVAACVGRIACGACPMAALCLGRAELATAEPDELEANVVLTNEALLADEPPTEQQFDAWRLQALALLEREPAQVATEAPKLLPVATETAPIPSVTVQPPIEAAHAAREYIQAKDLPHPDAAVDLDRVVDTTAEAARAVPIQAVVVASERSAGTTVLITPAAVPDVAVAMPPPTAADPLPSAARVLFAPPQSTPEISKVGADRTEQVQSIETSASFIDTSAAEAVQAVAETRQPAEALVTADFEPELTEPPEVAALLALPETLSPTDSLEAAEGTITLDEVEVQLVLLPEAAFQEAAATNTLPAAHIVADVSTTAQLEQPAMLNYEPQTVSCDDHEELLTATEHPHASAETSEELAAPIECQRRGSLAANDSLHEALASFIRAAGQPWPQTTLHMQVLGVLALVGVLAKRYTYR